MTTSDHTYFFLSYASAGPMSDGDAPTPDPSVTAFYEDLSRKVRERASRSDTMSMGFFDQEVPPEADRSSVLEQALGAAEVFVALYSPRYFNRSAPLRELRLFQQRLQRANANSPECHIVPVLWTPLAPGKEYHDIQRARALGNEFKDYLDNGMRALRTLTLLRKPYEEITAKLARQIVDCAELHTIGPSPALPPDVDTEVDDSEVELAIAVLAPEPAAEWRPFAQRQDLTARYVANTAERFVSATKVGDLDAMRDLFQRLPALLLVDPRILRADNGQQRLSTAIESLPRWVTPLVIADGQHTSDIARATAEVVSLLQEAGLPTPRPVTHPEEFVELMPAIVIKARRRFLDLTTSQTGSSKLSLRGPGGPASELNGTIDD